MSPEEVAELVEFTEADGHRGLFLAAPPELADQLKLKVARFGPARARVMGAVNATLFNAVTGLGVGEPATEEALDEIINLYRPYGVDFMVQLSPVAQPVELARWLEVRGFRHRDDWVKVYRDASPPPDVPTDLTLREIGPEQANDFAKTVMQGFGIPLSAQALVSLIASGVGSRGWRQYLAYDGEAAVASSAMYIKDGVAWLGLGATLPSHRRRGAQGAMFARRIKDAIELGCRWLVTETDAETPSHPSISYHNMVRSGFVMAYNRPNYVWSAEAKGEK